MSHKKQNIISICILILGIGSVFLFFNGLKNKNIQSVKDMNVNYPKQTKDIILKNIKTQYLHEDGMVESEKSKTTSESQSYGMLISVLSEDRESFDRIWDWTKSNLQIREDKLFSWKWEDGKVADKNPATDADQDIAYALYLAHEKWGNEAYLNDAKEIIGDIWNIETKEIGGVHYVAAGNWAVKVKNSVIINPSYLAPYQYRIFANLNPEHDWLSLVESSYHALELCTGRAGLVRNWCQIDKDNKVITEQSLTKNSGSNYSFDALRVPYRIAMDYSLNNEPKALEYLKKNELFTKDWKENGKIFAVYNQQGEYVGKNESLSSYGAQLARMSLIDKEIAKEIFEKKVMTIDSWENVGFYDMSWIWLGLNFYENEINNAKIESE